jgi:hypothetical protein
VSLSLKYINAIVLVYQYCAIERFQEGAILTNSQNRN